MGSRIENLQQGRMGVKVSSLEEFDTVINDIKTLNTFEGLNDLTNIKMIMGWAFLVGIDSYIHLSNQRINIGTLEDLENMNIEIIDFDQYITLGGK